VAQAYRLADRPDPRLDRDGKSSFLLQRQIRGYKKLDPSKKQQVALTGSILRELHKMAFTPLEKALCELFTGAFFFAMRSCEYLKVSGERRTKIIQLQNIRFFKGKREVSHSDPNLSSSSTVSITFVLQKKDQKFDTVTHHRSNHSFICNHHMGKNRPENQTIPKFYRFNDKKYLQRQKRYNPLTLRSIATETSTNSRRRDRP